MNANEITEQIKTEITKICENNRKRYGRQYPVAKWARVQLQELGLWEMFSEISRGYKGDPGQSDAQDVLADATNHSGAGFTADGEGEAWSYVGKIGGLLKQLKQVGNEEAPAANDETDDSLVIDLDIEIDEEYEAELKAEFEARLVQEQFDAMLWETSVSDQLDTRAEEFYDGPDGDTPISFVDAFSKPVE